MAPALATDSCCPQITLARPAKPGAVRRISNGPARSAIACSRRSAASSAARCCARVAAESSLPWIMLEGAGWEEWMPSKPIFRFAPSPNGRLHLGHAFSALFTAHWATELDGSFLLRIEDIDIGRSRRAFTEAIFADLRWLGLSWPEPVWHQSQRLPHYEAAAARLRAMELLFPCFCSRSDVA